MLTGPAWNNVLILTGMAWAVGAVCCLLTRPATGRLVLWPLALIAAGFWLTGSVDTVMTIGVTAAVAGLAALAVRILAAGERPQGVGQVPGPVLAVVLATAVLVHLGCLLAIRLVIVPDPADPFGAGLRGDAWQTAQSVLIYPLLGFAVLLGLVWLASTRLRRVPVAVPRWHLPVPARLVSPGIAILVTASFALPLLDRSGSGAALTFWGVATPEFGKLAFIVVLALLVVRDSHRFTGAAGLPWRELRRRGGPGLSHWPLVHAWLRARRFVLYPLGLFTVVAGISGGLRQDFGTVVSVLAATVGVTWAATRHAVRQAPDLAAPGGRTRFGRWLGRMVPAYRPFLLPGGVLIFVTIILAWLVTDYVDERARIWANPWQYRWSAGCLPSDPAVTSPDTPDGTVACQRSLVADAESERSQLARALSAVADGGLWGRGLADTASAAVPAGSTDFIYIVMWNKLGAIIVLLAVTLTALLGAALRQVSRAGPPPIRAGPSMATLIGSGFATMLVGQSLFVFAATLNVLPHSGVPAPFLSRGGQSNLALLLGVLLVLVMSRTNASPSAGADGPRPTVRTGQAPPPTPLRVLLLTGTDGRAATCLPIAICVAIATGVTLVPYPAPNLLNGRLPTAYDENRPPCPDRELSRAALTSVPPDPAGCSTDQFAVNRTRIEVRFADGPGLVLNRPGGDWLPPGDAHPSGLILSDLTGLLRTGDHLGVLDQSYPHIVGGTAGTDLGRRLTPRPRTPAPDGGLNLTIRPALQHAAATAMRSPNPHGGGPFAGGLVLLNASTGHVLASVSVPTAGPGQVTGGPPAEMVDTNRFLDRHAYYGRLGPDSGLDSSTPDDRCRRQSSDPTTQSDCWKWSLSTVDSGAARIAEDEQRRYVDGDQAVEPPAPEVNRAVGQWYGLGSTFKVIIAAAYLAQPGTGAADLIPAPDQIALPGRPPIHNSGTGRCPGITGDGRITLAQALAHSCNTAFVALAIALGWSRIADTAGRLGFRVGPCQGDGPWAAHRLIGAVDSCLPTTSDGTSIGNNALGGQDVQGTPLALATVLAAVANDGRAVAPTIVTAVRRPDTGDVVATPDAEVSTAFSPATAAQLRTALAGTAIDGTAQGLNGDVGTELWVKTGTHEVIPEGEPARPGSFVRQNCWLVGFVETPGGPLAFAVVVESRDERAGAQQARHIVTAVVEAIRRNG